MGAFSVDDGAYERRVFELGERLSEQKDVPVSVQVDRAVEEKLSGIVGFLLFAGAIWKWHWWGVLYGVIGFFAWASFTHHHGRRQRGAEPEKVVPDATDYIRFRIMGETHAAGEPCWAVTPKQYDTDTPRVGALDNPRWADFWQRVYETALEFKSLSPHERDKRLKQAARAAEPALRGAKKMAAEAQAGTVFWVDSALYRLSK